MSADSERELVAALARRVVADRAPAELPLFRATSQAYFENPNRVLGERRESDDVLGFGAAEAVLLLTPVALDVARSVVGFVVAHVRDTASQEAGQAVDDATSRLLHRFGVGDGAEGASEADVLALTADQLREVHRIAFEKAQQLKVPAETADLLADSLVGCLAAE